MAFGCTITVQAGQISSSQNDFVWLVNADNFPTAAIDGGLTSIDNGGGNLRCYTDSTKATPIPIHVVKFVTGVSPSVEVRGKSPTLNVASTVYIEADDTETVQPPVTDPLGRNAVYSDYRVMALLNETANTGAGGYVNSTGNADGTGVSMSLANGTTPWGGDSSTFDGSSDYIDFPLTESAGDTYTRSVWAKCVNLGSDQRTGSLYRTDGSTSDSVDVIWMDSGGSGDGWQAQTRNESGGTSTAGLASDNDATTDWQKLDMVRTGSTLTLYLDGSSKASVSASGNLFDGTFPNILRIARLWAVGGSGGYFGGEQSSESLTRLERSADYIEAEYNNQSDTVSFWSTGPWEDQDTGLTIDVPLVLGETLVYSPTVEKELIVEVPQVLSETVVYAPVVELQKLLDVPLVLSESNVLSPEVLKQIILDVPQVVSETLVYDPEIAKPKFINLDEVVQPQTQVFNPFVIIGDGIIIPVEDRFNYNKLANYLRTQGFEGQNNDVIMDWLFSEGYEIGQFNDRMSDYLTGQGYTGALPDQKGQWKRDI